MSSHRNAPLSTRHFFVYLISSPRTIYLELLHHARLARRDFIRPDRERWQWRSRLLLPAALVVIWMIVLWWGEVHVFRNSVDRCHWRTWERWVALYTTSNCPRALADPIHSPKTLLLTILSSSQTLSWLIPIPTLVVPGRCPLLLEPIPTTTCANPSPSYSTT